MKQLCKQGRTLGMHGVSESAITLDRLVLVELDTVADVGSGFMNRRDLDHDQTGATGRPCSVVGDEFIVDTFGADDPGLVTGAHYPVANHHTTNVERVEQIGKCVAHCYSKGSKRTSVEDRR